MSQAKPNPVFQNVEYLFVIAQEFCAHVERREHTDCIAWLHSVLPQMLTLKKAIEQVPAGQMVALPDADISTRFTLYSDLKEWFGELDSYWLQGDKSNDTPELTGSLADDFTDIYYELLPGLQYECKDIEDQRIVAEHWRAHYNVHWGDHLGDAMRYVSILKMCQRI